MRLHCIQHVSYEGPGAIEKWAMKNGHVLTYTRRFASGLVPTLPEFDWLIVMGGPMGVHDTHIFPWLREDKRIIENALSSKKTVLGICLGAQLLADVLGARVYSSDYKEVGWHNVHLTEEALSSPVWAGVPRDLQVFQWHGDTFDLPLGAVRAVKGHVCENQAFLCGKAIALQFHLESTLEDARKLVQECPDDLAPGPYVQTPQQFLSDDRPFVEANMIMGKLLDNLCETENKTTTTANKTAELQKQLDLRGVLCPINFVKIKVRLGQMSEGDVLDVLLDDGAPVQNVPRSLKEEGHKVLGLRQVDNCHYIVRVRKGA